MNFLAAPKFLGTLADNNDKTWFEAHKAEFESKVQEPALEFIEECALWFEMEGLPFIAQPKKSGGSLSRIYRDARFSNDKTPYHSHMVMHFRHQDFGKGEGPMLGVRIDADGAGLGGGLYGGPTAKLNLVRDAIVRAPESWAAAVAGGELWGEQLKTCPRGYDKDHPQVDDLRRKAFMLRAPADGFLERPLPTFQAAFPKVRPLVDFLAGALQ